MTCYHCDYYKHHPQSALPFCTYHIRPVYDPWDTCEMCSDVEKIRPPRIIIN